MNEQIKQRLAVECVNQLVRICDLHHIDFCTLDKKTVSLLVDVFQFGATTFNKMLNELNKDL